ncbi:unnamed protein product [Rotaria sp. Silwood1]|nr:unnamed protein product [Rotaria sp. Silwood1]CAF1631729.1 unnamed protein product [Rotaria sp. Silwood1]
MNIANIEIKHAATSTNSTIDSVVTEPRSTSSRKDKIELIKIISAILVPLMIGVFTIVTTIQELKSNKQARDQELLIFHLQHEQNKDLADNAQKQTILNEYQSFLAKLLREDGIQLDGNKASRLVTRYRTLTALAQLDPTRKVFLFKSLYEAKLISYKKYNATHNENPVIDLSSADLTNVYLEPSSSSIMDSSVYEQMDLSGVNLRNASLSRLRFSNVRFRGTAMDMVDLRYTFGTSVDFYDSSLNQATFYKAEYKDTIFREARLKNANLTRFICKDCLFMDSDLENAVFSDGNYYYGDFLGASMSNCIMVNAYFLNSSFAMADFNGCTMHKVEFVDSDFQRANFQNIDLTDGMFINCAVHDTDFRNCTMIRTELSGSTFRRANFEGCTGLTDEQLKQAKTLAGSTLPNVQQLLHTGVANLERIASGLPHEDLCYGVWLDFNLVSMRTETIGNKLYELRSNLELQRSRERVKELEAQFAQL